MGCARSRDGAREGLVKVMMCVDETRHNDVPREVEDFVGFVRQTGSCPCVFDESVFYEKTTIRQFGLVVVHGEEVGVLD